MLQAWIYVSKDCSSSFHVQKTSELPTKIEPVSPEASSVVLPLDYRVETAMQVLTRLRLHCTGSLCAPFDNTPLQV